METILSPIREHGVRVGRVLIGFLFFFTGLGVILDGAAGMTAMLTGMGLPMAMVLAWLVGIFKFAAGTALMVNKFTEYAAVGLIGFTLIASALAHLDYMDTNLWKNLAIIGGLMMVIAAMPKSAGSMPGGMGGSQM